MSIEFKLTGEPEDVLAFLSGPDVDGSPSPGENDGEDGDYAEEVPEGDTVVEDKAVPGVPFHSHPFFYAIARFRARLALRSKGYGFLQINDILSDASNELIDVAASQVGADGMVSSQAFGDGHIIDAILKFFESPTGQALLAALLKLLLGLI